MNIAQGSRVTSSAIGAEFTFSLQEADDWRTRMLPELVPEKRNVGHEPGVQMLEQLDDGQ